ncbi:MAG TPA: thymidine kinase [Saprospiraceae bacterium]|nr:thymidine kinase [Saprospiraceae bacterium]
MFLEPHFRGQRSGWIEVICGAMFSGKTEELIRRLKRAGFANQRVLTFKPALDKRYHEKDVISHDENVLESYPVEESSFILDFSADYEVIGIDEAQFFDDGLVEVCEELANRGKRVVVAGLDMDYKGKPFGPVPNLLAVAEYITKVHAICKQCGSLATHSYRIASGEDQVLLGEKDSYEPRCRVCFSMGNILDFNAGDEQPRFPDT